MAETDVAQQERKTPGYLGPTLVGLIGPEPCCQQQRLFTGSGSWWNLDGDGSWWRMMITLPGRVINLMKSMWACAVWGIECNILLLFTGDRGYHGGGEWGTRRAVNWNFKKMRLEDDHWKNCYDKIKEKFPFTLLIFKNILEMYENFIERNHLPTKYCN